MVPFVSLFLAWAGAAGEEDADDESDPEEVDDAAPLSLVPAFAVPLSPDDAAGTVDSLDLELPPDRLSVL